MRRSGRQKYQNHLSAKLRLQCSSPSRPSSRPRPVPVKVWKRPVVFALAHKISNQIWTLLRYSQGHAIFQAYYQSTYSLGRRCFNAPAALANLVAETFQTGTKPNNWTKQNNCWYNQPRCLWSPCPSEAASYAAGKQRRFFPSYYT